MIELNFYLKSESDLNNEEEVILHSSQSPEVASGLVNQYLNSVTLREIHSGNPLGPFLHCRGGRGCPSIPAEWLRHSFVVAFLRDPFGKLRQEHCWPGLHSEHPVSQGTQQSPV